MEKEYWQVAAGSGSRDYVDKFLQFGMAFVGGDEPIATMEQVKLGDIVILKRGLSKIVAVGEVVSRDGGHRGNKTKPWLRDFDGWDLSAFCHVEWRKPAVPINTDGLTRATITRVQQSRHRELADANLSLPVLPHSPEPREVDGLSDDEILDELIANGLRPAAADELTTTLRRIRLLAEYYYKKCRWEDVREHEARTFLVIPLLLALGWAEQQLKIELPCGQGRVDIAGFRTPYHRGSTDCMLLIETKDFSSGLDQASGQAQRYAADFPSCGTLLVSNGYCYKLFSRKPEANEFAQTASGYLNLLNPRKRYPLDPDNVDGGLRVLLGLLPSSLR